MGGVASAVVGTVGSIVASGQAGRAERAARNEQNRRQAELEALEAGRQPIVNPYANYSDLSDMASNLGDMVSNPYANLGVATQAAEFQAEQADMALSSTLDSMVASGASAGGATALARAALQSQRGISASIQQQELKNQQLAAQGEQMAQTQRRNLLLQAEQEEVAAFNRQERRDDVELGMMRQDEQFQANLEQAYAQAESEAIEATIGAVGEGASTIAGNPSQYGG